MYDRDALLAATDLRALADDLLGPGKRSGRSAMWPCPSDQHAQTGRTPPVSVFNSRRGEQRWRCHGCGDGGTAIDLVLAVRGGTPRDALDFLAQRTGHRAQLDQQRPQRRPTKPRALPPSGCSDQQGLDRYVNDCAARLWSPEGITARRWLTNTRGLPADVLACNRVGADPGPRRQERPDGMPRAAGVVLPVVDNGHSVYAQLRVIRPAGDRPRYLNPTGELATNPRVVRARPTEVRHPEVVVTEGAIDALSAAAAGYRAVGVLSAAYGDEAVALALAKLPYPLVLALDADDAGRSGAQRLATFLAARQRPALLLDLGNGDLNDAMRRCDDWPQQMATIVAAAAPTSRLDLAVGT